MKIQFELFDSVIGLVLVIGCLCETVTTSNAANASSIASIQSTSNQTSTLPSFAPVLPLSPNDDKNDPELARRRAFVRNMMKHAWDGYVKCAWRKSYFQPISCQGNKHRTIEYVLKAMPALWIMGLHEEFNSAQKWIVQVALTFREYSKGFYGALLSCYALTGDTNFLDIAIERASIWTSYKGEYSELIYIWLNSLLEFPYLTHLTGNQSFIEFSQRIEQKIEKGLPGLHITLPDKLFHTHGAYLLLKVKRYIQSNQTDDRTKIGQFYRDIEQLKDKGNLNRTKSGLWYFGGVRHPVCGEDSGEKRHFPIALCNIGSILSLDAQLLPKVLYNATSWRQLSVNQLASVITHWELAKNITDTCYWGSKLSSEYMIPSDNEVLENGCYRLNITSPNINETIIKNEPENPFFILQSFYILESYFTLWRATGEQRYRDYAWEMANKIEQYARVPNGYTNGLPSKIKENDVNRDFQPIHLPTTLLYLYLTFTPDSYLPLDKWVFTDAGYPLPICGHNPAYPKCT